MKFKMKGFTAALALFLVLLLTAAQDQTAAISPDEARQIASEAYFYTYPLVLMDITRRVTINAEASAREGFGPMNMFTHMRFRPVISKRSSGPISIRCIPLPGST